MHATLRTDYNREIDHAKVNPTETALRPKKAVFRSVRLKYRAMYGTAPPTKDCPLHHVLRSYRTQVTRDLISSSLWASVNKCREQSRLL